MAAELTGIEAIREVLQARPLAVLTDMDGTLSPIVDRAEDAYVPEQTRQALRELVDSGVHVVVITGRALGTARRMVDVPGVDFAAAHGADMWIDGRNERPAEVAEWTERARNAIEELRAMEGSDGVWIEDKEFGLAIHYRNAEDVERVREAILETVRGSDAASEFDIQEGRKIVELRPRLWTNKGTAAALIVERLNVAGIVCLGDDLTDIDMFREARNLREGGLAAAIVAVRSEEASPEVVESADYWIDGVEGVARLLGEIVRETS